MTDDVVAVGSATSSAAVAGMFALHGINGVPVAGEDDHVVGMVSASDLLSRSAATVGGIMSSPAVTVYAEQTAAEAARLMPVVAVSGSLPSTMRSAWSVWCPDVTFWASFSGRTPRWRCGSGTAYSQSPARSGRCRAGARARRCRGSGGQAAAAEPDPNHPRTHLSDRRRRRRGAPPLPPYRSAACFPEETGDRFLINPRQAPAPRLRSTRAMTDARQEDHAVDRATHHLRRPVARRGGRDRAVHAQRATLEVRPPFRDEPPASVR
ncbi:CBS domain-containing protein [Streptomyces griseobrunneus]